MFAAKFLAYKRSRDEDEDATRSKLLYKQLRRVLEEVTPLLSDSLQPEALIWRIWHFMERETLSVREMEEVGIEHIDS